MTSDKYVLKKDLVIPAGTVFSPAAKKTVRHSEHVAHDAALGPDNTVSIVVPVEKDDEEFNAHFAELRL